MTTLEKTIRTEIAKAIAKALDAHGLPVVDSNATVSGKRGARFNIASLEVKNTSKMLGYDLVELHLDAIFRMEEGDPIYYEFLRTTFKLNDFETLYRHVHRFVSGFEGFAHGMKALASEKA